MKSFPPRRLRTHRAVFIVRSFLILTIAVATVFVVVRNNNSRSSAASSLASETIRPARSDSYGRPEMSFERNQGQTDRQVKFLARGRGYDLFLTPAEVVLTLRNASVLRLSMAGSKPASSIEGEEELPGKVNYLLGDDARQWHTNIPTYRKIRYRGIYPGVDVVYYGNQRQLEYDFVVAAGRDPGVIKFKLAGADRIDLDESGDLRLTVKDSEVRLDKPFIYQLTETGERSEVKGEYVVKGKEIGFKVQAFDSQKPLIIDPVLSYATLLGSSGDESGNGIAVDAHGNAYVTGVTNSATFPTTPPPGSLQPPPGTAFVTKIDATGSNLIYSTYLGFNGTIATAIAVDSSGNAYVTGSTPADAVIHKLNPTGSDVTFSMRFGGSGEDRANGIALDNSGNIIVVGQTTSTNFPTINAIKPAIDPSESCSQDGFVTKINPAAIGFVFSTYLGGNKCDRANAVATDAAGNVYVTGETDSANFPIANAFQPAPGNPSGKDAFATKISTSGSLAYSTYLGGSGDDTGHAVAVDASSNAYITGNTTSTNYPTTSAVQPTGGADFGGDAFVTKLNSVGSSLVYSTYLGGSSTDTGRGIAVDTTGNAYVTGSTFSVDFPVVAGALRTRSPLFRSTDGAANWNNDTSGFKDAGIADIAINPAQPSILYAATFTGVFKSTNSGRTWSPSNNGLQSLFVNRVVVDPATPSRIYAVTNGPNFATAGIYRSLDGGNTWTRASNGISNTTLLGLAIDPVNPATLYLSALGRGMYKSTNGGDSWTLVGNPTVTNSNFIVVDPFNHTTIYATDFNNEIGGIFRSTDAGATWERIGSTQLGGGGRFVAVSPHTPGLVYATTNGGLFKSVDGGNNWSSVRVLGGKVFFDPVNPSTIYLLDLSELLVLKSNDNGQTWFPANKGLNTTFANVLAIDPANPSILYTATSNGTDNDAFVTKINPAGNALVYSTCLGGASNAGLDESAAIAIDSAGNAYITGTTNAFDFMSTPEAYQPINLGSTDVFIAKLTMSHSISGHVVDTSNAPLSGAEVVLSDGETITSIFTDSVGYYEFPRLREGGSFTVNANKANFTMAPPSQTFDNLTANQVLNFTATPVSSPFFTISGRVTEGGVGLRGVTITVSGSQESVRITDSNGDYSFTLPGGGTYTVTPSLAPLTFTLPSQTFFNLSLNQRASFTVRRTEFVVTNINNHGPGSLRQAILDANATPGRDVILFNLPGNGVHIINLLVGLPAITDEVFISATGESEFGSPTVELNGAGTGGAIGLFIQAGNTTISGLAIGGFSIGIAALDCDNNIIQGNHIGLDWSGTSSRPNGQGILLLNSSHNLIGGASPSARNVISSNQFDGVTIVGSNNLVQGNWIGPNTAGRIGFGNGAAGVSIGEVPFFPPSLAISHDNVIGGTTPLAGNVIAYNNGPGVFVASETGNTIRRNSIFSNSGLGIELFDLTIDPTVNDPGDPDTGPNLLQNFPLLTSVVSDGTSTRIQGTLNSTPNTTFQIDFYSNVACDPSGNGEGERVFNAFNNDTAVTTDANGDATIDITFPVALPPGRALTATATDPQGNTSEFSPCDAGNVAGSAEFSVSSRTVNEDVGSITVTVLRKGGSAGILAVDYFTSEATATADQDYTSVSGRLVFNNGETSKSFQIQINNDSTFEQDETFTVFLSATNASVNVPGAQTVTLQDRSTLPTVFLDNGASASIVVNEGNSGTTDAVFIARLSAETGRTVSVDFATVNEPSPDSSASATAGAACGPFVDFEKKSGTLVFQPGEMVQTFAVKVCGDTNAEFHESIFVNILNPTNSAPPPFGRGFMVIADDDVLLLAFDESGPAANQAAAIESHLMLRDPFRIPNVAEWMPIGTDPNTRVTLFVSGLELNQGESANAVGIILIASNGQSFFLGAQDVRAVPNVPFTQVTFRLPDLPSGECQVSIWAHDHTSNTATIRIAP
ncbi:MAG TPA: SBBP repeat-containing protein [Pyrinomonadaceae bacterium]|nr:SBBP repeat-containing protein [Pyrinomonadaceae bacterium]